MKTLRYEKEDLPFAYRHMHHAGNVGDVWKHLIWIALIEGLQESCPALSIFDCYAGQGEYELKSTGEWTEGIGKIAAIDPQGVPALLHEYLQFVEELGFNATPRKYPGSPRLCERMLRPSDRLRCYELIEEVYADLQSNFTGKSSVEVIHGDGLEVLRKRSKGRPGDTSELFLLDPAWTTKREWLELPALLTKSHATAPEAHFALWYPIKSYTRVNEMQRILREGKTPFICLELITTPLSHKRNRLNGSGVLLINPPEQMLLRIGEIAHIVGERAAIFDRRWEYKLLSF